MAEHLKLYNAVRTAPQEALKQIAAGRLKGKSDINPMWRIKTLTEHFGPCGFGWYYEITSQWLERGSGNEVAAFCNINLYVKFGDEWSKPIQGTGGSSFVASEKNGLYTSDECYKMALTDAISVACKALGMAADVYWNSDRTKYDQPHEPVAKKTVDPALLPGGERFQKAVEMYVNNKTVGNKTARDVWAANIKATKEQLDAFDDAVLIYRVNQNQ